MSLFREAREAIFDALDYAVTAESGSTFNTASENTANLQNAIDAASIAGGGTVILPPGRIPLDGTINIHDTANIYIKGSGMGVTTITSQDSSIDSFLFRNSTNIGISDLTNDTAGPIRFDGETTTARGVTVRNLEDVNDDSSTLLILRDFVEDFVVDNLVCDSSQGAIALWGAQKGMISNIYGNEVKDELIDFAPGAGGVLNMHITVVNAHSVRSDTSGAEEAFDIANADDLHFYNCSGIGHTSLALVKTGDQSSTVGFVSFNDCYGEVGEHAIDVAFFSDSDGKPAQGPVHVNRCNFKKHSGAASASAAIQHKAEAGASQNTDSKGVIVRDTLFNGFDYLLEPNGIASYSQFYTTRASGLKGIVDNSGSLNGAAGEARGWRFEGLQADAGMFLDGIVRDFVIDGIDLEPGPNNTEDTALLFGDAAQGLKIMNIKLQNFQEAGIDINYFSGTGIDANFNQDLVITNATMKDINLNGSGSFGIGLNFASGGSAGQSIYGVYISGIRVYSEDASDSANRIINLQKQNYDSIDAAVITDCIGRGFSTGIKNSTDLGSNTHTSGIVTAG